MEALIRNWTLLGALTLALAMGTMSAIAGVSFLGIMIRLIIGVSAFLVIAGIVSGWIGRSLLRRMVEFDTRDSEKLH